MDPSRVGNTLSNRKFNIDIKQLMVVISAQLNDPVGRYTKLYSKRGQMQSDHNSVHSEKHIRYIKQLENSGWSWV